MHTRSLGSRNQLTCTLKNKELWRVNGVECDSRLRRCCLCFLSRNHYRDYIMGVIFLMQRRAQSLFRGRKNPVSGEVNGSGVAWLKHRPPPPPAPLPSNPCLFLLTNQNGSSVSICWRGMFSLLKSTNTGTGGSMGTKPTKYKVSNHERIPIRRRNAALI